MQMEESKKRKSWTSCFRKAKQLYDFREYALKSHYRTAIWFTSSNSGVCRAILEGEWQYFSRICCKIWSYYDFSSVLWRRMTHYFSTKCCQFVRKNKLCMTFEYTFKENGTTYFCTQSILSAYWRKKPRPPPKQCMTFEYTLKENDTILLHNMFTVRRKNPLVFWQKTKETFNRNNGIPRRTARMASGTSGTADYNLNYTHCRLLNAYLCYFHFEL